MTSENRQENFYDKQYRAMDNDEANVIDFAWYKPFLPFAKDRNDVACTMLADRRFKNVVELGCGRFDIVRKKCTQFDRYTGVDISSYRLACLPASLKNAANISLVEHDLNKSLEFSDSSVDLVLTMSVIQYLLDPVHFIQDIYRILEKDGVLILNTCNLAFLTRRLQLLFGMLPVYNAAPGWQGGILHDFTFPSMRRLLRDSGFTIEKETCSGLIPPFRMWWPNLLASDMTFQCRK